jgi:hypothetical protein
MIVIKARSVDPNNSAARSLTPSGRVNQNIEKDKIKNHTMNTTHKIPFWRAQNRSSSASRLHDMKKSSDEREFSFGSYITSRFQQQLSPKTPPPLPVDTYGTKKFSDFNYLEDIESETKLLRYFLSRLTQNSSLKIKRSDDFEIHDSITEDISNVNDVNITELKEDTTDFQMTVGETTCDDASEELESVMGSDSLQDITESSLHISNTFDHTLESNLEVLADGGEDDLFDSARHIDLVVLDKQPSITHQSDISGSNSDRSNNYFYENITEMFPDDHSCNSSELKLILDNCQKVTSSVTQSENTDEILNLWNTLQIIENAGNISISSDEDDYSIVTGVDETPRSESPENETEYITPHLNAETIDDNIHHVVVGELDHVISFK